MTEELGGWGRPEHLTALWLLVPLVVLSWAVLRSRRRALGRLLLAGAQLASSSMGLHRLRLALVLTGIALGLVALAQPRWGYQWREIRQEGLSIAVVLDVSRSMDAQDVSPSRMERARRELLDLSDLLRGDRIGLVLAAGGAYPRMPLTQDVDAFRKIVRDSNTDTLRAQGSDLGRAIEVAVEMLDGVEAGDRAVLIVSDGEDQVGEAEAAANAAADKGVHIFTLGVGTTDGAPIPLIDGGFKKDGSGRVVLTRLDAGLLQRLAELGSGAYADSVTGTSDMEAIYVDGIRGGLSTVEQSVRREKVWQERYQWPLAAGLALLILGSALRPRRRRVSAAPTPGPSTRRAAAVWLAAGLGLALAPAADAASAELDALLAEQVQRPNDLELAERLGQQLFAEGDYNRAHEVLTAVAERTLSPEQRQRARSNAGLAAYRAGRLTRSVEDWTQVLTEDPEHPAASSNAEAVQQEIQQRLQQQQEQEQQSQDGQSDEQDAQPQDGQDQEGQDQEGEPQDGQPQDGEPKDGQDQEGQPQDGQQDSPPPDSEGTRDAAPDTGNAPQDGEIQPADGAPQQGETDTGATDEGQVHRPGSMSEQEADRLLEGVEEGTPRVTVDPDSKGGGKDW